MTNKRPNIILINCDDLGYGDLSCYGSPVHRTPALDSIAENGVKFTSFYMASPVCSPSRGAMMTGCYPPRIGFGDFDGQGVLFPGNPIGLNPEETTIADTLSEQGYATMVVGKWHCGDQPDFFPTRHGFHSYYGIPFSNDMGRQRGRDKQMPPLPLLSNETVIQEQPDQTALTERYLEKSLQFIRSNKSQPFFLYFAHMYVHLPIYPAERFLKQSLNGRYGAAVESIDWATQVLLHELRMHGIEENTLIIFTSDNGSRCDFGDSNGTLRGSKGTTWEGGMRLPCIMQWKGTLPAGTVNDELVTSMDLFPTLTNLAGGKVPTDRIIDGKDILPLMKNETNSQSPHDAFFYYHRNSLEAVRSGKWKLHVRKPNQQLQELYDLDNDPGESRNVYTQFPEVVKELSEKIEICKEDLGCSASGVEGKNCRPIGRIAHGVPLTEFSETYPYYMAEYDLIEAG